MSQFWHKKTHLAATAAVALGMAAMSFGSSPAIGTLASSHVRTASSPTHAVYFSDWEFPSNANPVVQSEVTEAEQTGMTQPEGNLADYLPDGSLTWPELHQQVPPIVSADHETIDFTLATGMKWSNGDPITAADYVFAWHVFMNGVTGPACTGTCDNVLAVSTPSGPGGLDVELHMKPGGYIAALPNAIVGLLDHNWAPPHGGVTNSDLANCLNAITGCNNVATAYENPANNYEDSSYATAGPFEISGWHNNSEVDYTANPNFTSSMGGSNNAPSTAKFVFYNSLAGMVIGADNGDTDITNDYTLFQYSSTLQNDHNFTTYIGNGANPEQLVLNAYDKSVKIDGAKVSGKQKNPLAGTKGNALKMRQAIYLALDYNSLLAQAYGLSLSTAKQNVSYCAPIFCSQSDKAPFSDFSGSGQGIWDPIAKKFVTPGQGKGLKDAKTLFKQASGGKKLTLYVTTTTGNDTRNEEQQFIIGNLHNAFKNLSVKPANQPAGAYFDTTWSDNGTLSHGNYEMAIYAYGGVSPNPDGWKGNFLKDKCQQTDKNHAAGDQNVPCLQGPIANAIDNDLNSAGVDFTASRATEYAHFQQDVSKGAMFHIIAPRPEIWTTDGKPTSGFLMNGWVSNLSWNAQDWRQ